MAEDFRLMEEEIDLRIYIDVLLRWWWLIVLGAALAGGSAFLVSSLMTPSYQATAGVVTLKSRVELSLGSGVRSLTDEDLAMGDAGQAVLERARQRLNSLVGMVKNGAIAEQVSDELSDMWDKEENEDEGEPSWLIDRVEGEVLEDSDTIRILVAHSDPEKAAAIANAWAHAFEKRVNTIYSEAPYTPFADINQQVENARADYDQTQEKWVNFLAEEDRIGELQRQIAEQEELLTRLRAGRQDSVTEIVNQQVGVQKRIFDISVGSEINFNLSVFEKRLNELISEYTDAYARKWRFENLLYEANVIQEQLAKGDAVSASSSGLALFNFKQKVLATGGIPIERVELQAASLEDVLLMDRSLEDQLTDLDALVAMMEAEVDAQERIIQAYEEALAQNESYQFLEALTPEYLDMTDSESELALQRTADWKGLLGYSELLESPFTDEIDQLEREVRRLKADVARLDGIKSNLQRDRDLAQQAYNDLLSKQQELLIASAAEGTEVRFASPALPPRSPVGPKKMMNAAIGLALGGMLGVFGAFLFDYIGVESDPRRLLSRREAKS